MEGGEGVELDTGGRDQWGKTNARRGKGLKVVSYSGVGS